MVHGPCRSLGAEPRSRGAKSTRYIELDSYGSNSCDNSYSAASNTKNDSVSGQDALIPAGIDDLSQYSQAIHSSLCNLTCSLILLISSPKVPQVETTASRHLGWMNPFEYGEKQLTHWRMFLSVHSSCARTIPPKHRMKCLVLPATAFCLNPANPKPQNPLTP